MKREFIVLGWLGSLALLPACREQTQEAAAMTAPTASISFAPSDEQRARAGELAGSVDATTWRFATGNSAVELAPAYLLLAATHPEPRVIAAALSEMAAHYTARHVEKRFKPTVDEDYVRAVEAALEHPSPRVVSRALLACRTALEGEFAERMLDAALRVGAREDFGTGPERQAFLDFAVSRGTAARPNEVSALLVSSLSVDEPYVLDFALRSLLRVRKFDAPPEVVAKALPLSRNQSAAVSGAAIELLGKLGSTSPSVSARALGSEIAPALGSNEPFVRARAAAALGALHFEPAIPELLRLLDDTNVAETQLEPWTELEGNPSSVQVRRTTPSTVRGTALLSLVTLSDGGFVLQASERRSQGLEPSIEAVRAWYGARGAGAAPSAPGRAASAELKP